MENCTCSFENSKHDYLCQLTPKCQNCRCQLDLQSFPYLTICENCGILNHRNNLQNNRINQLLRRWMNAHPMQNDSVSFFLQNSQEAQRFVPSTIPGEFEIHGDCSICNSQIEQINAVKPSGCIHSFHENCLSQWVRSDCANHDKCPDCRVVIGTILKKN